MPRRHTYEVSLAWTGNRGSGTSSYRDYGRDHQVAAEGRPPIEGSSEPLFRGDPARWNPELELTAALSQCRMLWYLHLCAVSGVVVTSYADDAHGVMEETEDGGVPAVVISSRVGRVAACGGTESGFCAELMRAAEAVPRMGLPGGICGGRVCGTLLSGAWPHI